ALAAHPLAALVPMIVAAWLVAGVAWAVARRGHVRLALLWALATAGGGSLNTLIKHAFARVRPDALHGYAYADGFSFPSVHAAGALAGYGMLGYLALRLTPPRWPWPALLAASAIIATVGWSRVALQVH